MGRSHYQRDSCLEGSEKVHSGWSPAEEERSREEEGRRGVEEEGEGSGREREDRCRK